MAGAEIALRHQPRVAVEQRRREIVALAHALGEGGVAERDAELLGDRHQGVPDHRQGDRIEAAVGTHARSPLRETSILRLPAGLIRTVSPGSTTTVQSGSSTMAGPCNEPSAASARRSTTRVSV